MIEENIVICNKSLSLFLDADNKVYKFGQINLNEAPTIPPQYTSQISLCFTFSNTESFEDNEFLTFL